MLSAESGSKLSPPRIVCAANRFTAKDYTGQAKPYVVAGARHHDSVMNPIIRSVCNDDPELLADMEQGFIDQHGRFYTRREAWVIAERNGQIARRCGGDGLEAHGLFSENLY